MTKGEWRETSPTIDQGTTLYSMAMQRRGAEMQLRCDENGIPISAKCSNCGELMAQAQPRIMNPMENVEWFTSQFALHVAKSHPPAEPAKSAFGRMNQ
jgi:hypothetical protein